MKLTNLPIIKQLWARIRLKKILQTHRETAAFWQPIIDSYFRGEIDPFELKPQKEELVGKKIIWQYWGQGFASEQLPEVVRMCLKSVEKYKGEYEIIRLSDETIEEYIHFPEFVWEKRKDPEFTRTFFSDLLRLALLHVYGGVWLDATVLLTGPLPKEYADEEYFMFQRDEKEAHKKYWENSYAYYWGWHSDFKVNMLSSIVFSKKDSLIIEALFQLLLYYWQTQKSLINYFCFQVLYHELICNKLAKNQCAIVSDTIPHALASKLGGGYPFESYEDILQKTSIHKLTYKGMDKQQIKKIIDYVEL